MGLLEHCVACDSNKGEDNETFANVSSPLAAQRKAGGGIINLFRSDRKLRSTLSSHRKSLFKNQEDTKDSDITRQLHNSNK